MVRAHDKQNYYAMKFTIIEPGLRPGDRHGALSRSRRSKGPQSGNAAERHGPPQHPFHVAVDVQGNRVTASIEGQKVDTWTDDTAAAGGVGFFADAGERARLYWMKVSKNRTGWAGICAYLSGTGTRETAEVWGPGVPANSATAYSSLAARGRIVVAEADINLNRYEQPQGPGS